MKEQIKISIKDAIIKLYPQHGGIEFSVDFAPANIDADFASNAAMVLGKTEGLKPGEVAILLQEKLNEAGKGFTTSVAMPGFLNFKVGNEHWQEELGRILKAGAKYGASNANKGRKARVEYVSANPTGPIHIGNARGGPYGEVICRVLEATGYKVLREYFHNDVGGQVEKLGATLWYWYCKETGQEAVFPADGYQGEYLQEVAKAAVKKLGKDLKQMDLAKLVEFALDLIYKENFQLLKDLGIEFDEITKESELRTSGKTEKVLKELREKKVLVKKDGAEWFAPASTRSSLGGPNDEFLADREAVVVKSDGEPTYFASDIAYHKEKFASKYDLVVDIFGSNHHGHVPKLKALCRVFGYDPANFQVLLYQFVRVKRGQEVVKMSKRAGTYVTAREVLDEVGYDSMIFLLLMTAINTHIDFDLELAKDTSMKNPVFRVQYAHARASSILDKASGQKLKPSRESLAILKGREEITLIRKLNQYQELILELSESYQVHKIPHYLMELSDVFHSFYEKVKVLSEKKEESEARLALVVGAQTVLANGLRLMGIKPLEKM